MGLLVYTLEATGWTCQLEAWAEGRRLSSCSEDLNSKPRVGKIPAQFLSVPLDTVIHPAHWPRSRATPGLEATPAGKVAKAV